LIDDARFDSEVNAELSRESEQTLRRASDAGDDGCVVANNDLFAVSNGAAPTNCAIVLAARDAAALSRIFKVFEVDRGVSLPCKCFIGPIPWGHSGPLCHALSLLSSLSVSLSLTWTSMRRRRGTVEACESSDTW